MDNSIPLDENKCAMSAVCEIPNDVLRVLIDDVQKCIDKEAELIVEVITHKEVGVQEPSNVFMAAKREVVPLRL